MTDKIYTDHYIKEADRLEVKRKKREFNGKTKKKKRTIVFDSYDYDSYFDNIGGPNVDW